MKKNKPDVALSALHPHGEVFVRTRNAGAPRNAFFAAAVVLFAVSLSLSLSVAVGCSATAQPALKSSEAASSEASSSEAASSEAASSEAASSETDSAPSSAGNKTSGRFRFLSVEEAASFLGKADGFTRALSEFDRSIRMKTAKPVEDAVFLKFAAGEARAFNEDEKVELRKHIAAIDEALGGLPLSFPEEVLLIKTTGNEELGAAGYTRRNAIVLRENDDRPIADRVRIGLVAHELFHVLSSHSPELRKRAYALVDFHACIAGPIPADIEATRLTNPDAFEASCASISKGDEVSSRFPVLTVGASLAEALAEKNLFSALTVRLIAEAGAEVLRDGSMAVPWLASDTDFHQKLSKNTGYTIHPEEMLADNFSLWVRAQGTKTTPVKDAAFLERFAAVLRESSTSLSR